MTRKQKHLVPCFPKQIRNRKTRGIKFGYKPLRVESLEDRALLSVSAAELATIAERCAEIAPVDWRDVNVIELSGALNETALRDAVRQAQNTPQNDLIVVRTTAANDEIDLSSPLVVDFDSDVSGTLTVVGFGDSSLKLRGRETVLEVANGLTALGNVAFVGAFDAESTTIEPKNLLKTSGDGIALTQNVLFSVELEERALGAVGSKSPTRSSDYYAVETHLGDGKWAYLANVEVAAGQTVEGATTTYLTETLSDVNKIDPSSGGVDAYLCWAATASNMLAYAGWGPTQSVGDGAKIFNEFKTHFKNEGFDTALGLQWYFSGYVQESLSDILIDPSNPGGGHYAQSLFNEKYAETADRANGVYTVDASDMKAATDSLRAGAGVGLSVGWYENAASTERLGGHALTVYGYVYDASYGAETIQHYDSIILADSDDEKTGAFARKLSWHAPDKTFEIAPSDTGDYGDGKGRFENLNILLKNDDPSDARLATPTLQAVEVDPTSVTVCWNAVSNAAGYVLGYWKVGSDGKFEETFEFSSATTSHTIFGLTPNTEYVVAAIAVGGGDMESSDQFNLSVRTANSNMLATPANLTATTISSSSIKLAWSDVANESGYQIQYRAVGSLAWTTKTNAANETTFLATDLNPSSTYEFRVAAIASGSFADSAFTSEVFATTDPMTTPETPSTVVTTALDVVDDYDGKTSLREAISAAQEGETVTFDPSVFGASPKLILTAGQLEIGNKNVKIDGAVGLKQMTISGAGNRRVLHVGSGATVEIANLTITNGSLINGYGAGIYNAGTLTATNVVVAKNTVKCPYLGGGYIGGGGIYNAGTFTATNLTVIANTAVDEITGYTSKKRYIYGGGIYNTGTFIATDLTTTGNAARSNDSNSAYYETYGGGIYNTGAFIVTNGDISKNFNINYGGGIYNLGAFTAINVVVSENNSLSGGGGIYNGSEGTFTATNLVVTNNSSVVYGSGIYHNSEGTFTATNLVVSQNRSTTTVSSGLKSTCALYSLAEFTASNLIVVGNQGVGISGTITATNATVAGNTRGGVSAQDNKSTFYNAIVAYNGSYDISGSIRAFNILTSVDVPQGVNVYKYSAESKIFVVPPKFDGDGNLANANSLDLRLAQGSLAIDKGDDIYVPADLETDLEGNARIQGASVDLGAYESTIRTSLNSVSISGAVEVGETLTATVSPGGADATFQWFRDDVAIEGATSANYTIGADDVGYALTVRATGIGLYSGTVEKTTTIVPEPPAPKILTNLVLRTAPGVNNEQTTLPSGVATVSLGKALYADIWIKSADLDGAISGGYLNLNYPADKLEFVSVESGTIYKMFSDFADASTSGVVKSVGGMVDAGVVDKGDDEWIRLATVAFTVKADASEGEIALSLARPDFDGDNLTRTDGGVLSSQIVFDDAKAAVKRTFRPDIDEDGYVGPKDYTILSGAWRTDPDASNWNAKADINEDGYVGPKDYNFISQYWRQKVDDIRGDIVVADAAPHSKAAETKIEVVLTTRTEPTTAEESSERPTSASSFAATGSDVYVEVWCKSATAQAIGGGYLDLTYSTELLEYQSLKVGKTFGVFASGTAEDGVLRGVGGMTSVGALDKGDDEWIKFATILFKARGEGDAVVQATAAERVGDNLTLIDDVSVVPENIDFGAAALTVGEPKPLATPKIAKTEVGKSGILVRWNKIANASGYEVRYAPVGTDVYQTLTVDAGKTSALISDWESSTTYSIRVTALGGGEYADSEYSAAVEAKTWKKIATPKITETDVATGVLVKWSKVYGAASYTVTCVPVDASDAKTVSATFAADKSQGLLNILRPETTYSITVRANAPSGTQTAASESTAAVEVATNPMAAPTLIGGSPHAGSKGILLKWKAVNGATGYQIETREAGSDAAFTVATVDASTTAFVASDIPRALSYEIRIKAIGLDGVYADSAYTETTLDAKILTTPKVTKVVVRSNGDLLVNWQKVYGAASYTLEYKLDGATEFTAITGIPSVAGNKTLTGLVSGGTYTIRVKAVGSGSYVDSDYSVEATATTASKARTTAFVALDSVFEDFGTNADEDDDFWALI